MATLPVFGDKELESALKILGFTIHDDRGKGGHKLAKHPTMKPKNPRQYEHITIMKSKEYVTKDIRSTIIKEIMEFGFPKEAVILALKGKKKMLRKYLKI